MNAVYKILKVYQPTKSTSSSGRWCVALAIVWPSGLVGNHYEFFWRKSEAVKFYNKNNY
jgi:hypothetical protein